MTNDWKRELAEIVERARSAPGNVSCSLGPIDALAAELRKAAEEKPAPVVKIQMCGCEVCHPKPAPQPERPSAEDWKRVRAVFWGTALACGSRVAAQAARLASGEDSVIATAELREYAAAVGEAVHLKRVKEERDAAIKERDFARNDLYVTRGERDDARAQLGEARELLLRDFLARTTPSAGEGA